MSIRPPWHGYILRVVYRDGSRVRTERHEYLPTEHRWANSAFKDFKSSPSTISAILEAPGGRIVSQYLREEA
jgi:hypothetical protein